MSETNEGLHEAVDTTVAPPAEAAAEPEATTQTEPAEPDASAKPDGETAETKEPAPKRRPWWEIALAEARSNERETKRQLEALTAQKAPPSPPPVVTQPEVVPASEVEKRAAQLLDERQFVDACNDIADAGAAKHPDFGEAVRNFELLGEMPKAFLEAVTALGKDDGAKVYYDLGKDPAEAARVFRLPPVKMAMELQKMAAATPKIAAISKVPDPIEPITPNRGRGDAEPDPVKDSAAWTAWFNKARRNR